jgi:hypothetical protein
VPPILATPVTSHWTVKVVTATDCATRSLWRPEPSGGAAPQIESPPNRASRPLSSLANCHNRLGSCQHRARLAETTTGRRASAPRRADRPGPPSRWVRACELPVRSSGNERIPHALRSSTGPGWQTSSVSSPSSVTSESAQVSARASVYIDAPLRRSFGLTKSLAASCSGVPRRRLVELGLELDEALADYRPKREALQQAMSAWAHAVEAWWRQLERTGSS